MQQTAKCLLLSLCAACAAYAQSQSPSVSQVLMYSGTMPSLAGQTLNGARFNLTQAVPSIFTETGKPVDLTGDLSPILNGANYSVSRSFVQLNSALNASIATALSIIPLSSPASGVIVRKDPATGAELPISSTLGPIFTERAETIGKHQFYVGFSNQNYHFTRYNGTPLNNLSLLYTGGDRSNVVAGSPLTSVPATFSLGMDIRLSQNIAFLTYGVTNRFDVSVGLPVVHAAVAARTFNGAIYAGNGFATNGSACWCVSTLTPGFPTLTQPVISQSSLGKTGFGDLLVRVKGTVLSRPNVVVAIGGDVRFPTGDEQNYLGVGTTTVKPFAAVSFYSKPLANGIVVSPHFDAGWQFSGKSSLGGQLQGSPLFQDTPDGRINYIGAPFTTTKDYLPDVFTWAAGLEAAFGRHNTAVFDFLGNQVGWVHGMPNATNQTLTGVLAPTGPNGDSSGAAKPSSTSATGLVDVGRVSLGQYFASVGYKARIVGNLVVNVNLLIRLDDNGLVARTTPLFGIGYSF